MQNTLTLEQRNRKSNYSTAFIFMLISTILFSIILITLAWTIPMTIATSKASNEVGSENETDHLVLGICLILFCGLFGIIGGIFTIIGSSNFTNDIRTKTIENN